MSWKKTEEKISSISVDQALQIMMCSITKLEQERINFRDAIGRILAEDVISENNIPFFNNSAMDGYALKYADTVNIKAGEPGLFRIQGEVQAGHKPGSIKLKSGNAIRIMTGAPIPDNADTVIPVEETEEKNEYVHITRPLKKNENIRFAGEDISAGQAILARGRRLSSADIGLLASIDCKEVLVSRRPVVAIISTGDEIADIDEKLSSGKIRNSNVFTLLEEIKKYNCIPINIGIARDSMEAVKDMLSHAFQYDVVITTGGVSKGKYDFVTAALEQLGVSLKIKSIKMKPGKPLVFGTISNKLFFGLPGNPVSTMISFMQFVRPVLLGLMGAEKLKKPILEAISDDAIEKKKDKKYFIRGIFKTENQEIHVASTGPQGSGILRSMSEANCLIILPEDVVYVERGDKVMIQLIQHEEI